MVITPEGFWDDKEKQMKAKQIQNWNKEKLVAELKKRNFQYGELSNKYAELKNQNPQTKRPVQKDSYDVLDKGLNNSGRPVEVKTGDDILIKEETLEWIEEQLEIFIQDYNENINELVRVRRVIRERLGWDNNNPQLILEESGNTSPSPPPRSADESSEGGCGENSPTAGDTNSKQILKDIIKTIEKRKRKSELGTITRIYRYCKKKLNSPLPTNATGCREKEVKADDYQLDSDNGFSGDTISKDIKLARQCMYFKGLTCDNKDCLNKSCPLNKIYDDRNLALNVPNKIKEVRRMFKDNPKLEKEIIDMINRAEKSWGTQDKPKCKFCNDTKHLKIKGLDGTITTGRCPQCYGEDPLSETFKELWDNPKDDEAWNNFLNEEESIEFLKKMKETEERGLTEEEKEMAKQIKKFDKNDTHSAPYKRAKDAIKRLRDRNQGLDAHKRKEVDFWGDKVRERIKKNVGSDIHSKTKSEVKNE